jgi:putative membrane protein insertion efficiency factor
MVINAMMKRLLLAPIWVYRNAISPVIGPRCRYEPTCSTFAVEAIERHGAWAGGWMTTARLCRCHPLGPAGIDPVPEQLPVNGRWYMPWRYGRWTGRHMAFRTDRRAQRASSR